MKATWRRPLAISGSTETAAAQQRRFLPDVPLATRSASERDVNDSQDFRGWLSTPNRTESYRLPAAVVREAARTGVSWLFGSSRGGRGDGGELGPVGLAGVEQHADAPVGPVRDPERDPLDALGEVVDRFHGAVARA